jgi:hypothetical protein
VVAAAGAVRVRPIGLSAPPAHRLVARHEPFDVHRRGGHAATGERIGREAGPEDDAVGQRIARRDAERERVLVKARWLEQRTRAQLRDRRQCGDATDKCPPRRQRS